MVKNSMDRAGAIAEGTEILRRSLVAYETETFRRHYGDRWWDMAVAPNLTERYTEGLNCGLSGIGAEGALILLFSCWDSVFSYYTAETGPGVRPCCRRLADSICSSLRDLREGSAAADAHRLLKDMSELCGCIDPPAGAKISELCGRTVSPADNCPRPKAVSRRADPFPRALGSAVSDPEWFSAACEKSANDLLIFGSLNTDKGREGESVNPVESFMISGERDILCTLQTGLVDGQEYSLVVNGKKLPDDSVEFPFYDRDSHLLGVRLDPVTVHELASSENPHLELISDISFLTRNVLDFYRDFGGLVSLPVNRRPFPDGSYPVPESPAPTDTQLDAVRTALNRGFSYIWGAPGTGKTQMVLATALVACIAAGQRVAVVAPTNLSVEQVLRGLIVRIRENPSFRNAVDPSRDIVRLGTASEDFLREFPEICEKRVVDSLIERKKLQLSRLRCVPTERKLPEARDLLGTLLVAVRERGRCPCGEQQDAMTLRCTALEERICGILKGCGIEKRDLSKEKGVLETLTEISERLGSDSDISGYFGWTDNALADAEARLDEELDGLILRSLLAEDRSAKIIACTPHMYIARFVPRGIKGMGKPDFAVDRIFIDEAGYCSTVMAAALLTNGVPVTLLGDHMQLPPVCSVGEDAIADAKELNPDYFKDREFMRYWYLWDMSAIYLESMFLLDDTSIKEMHNGKLPPVCREMEVRVLTESYRFGPNLAEILDRIVYRTGIVGLGGAPLRIVCVDVASPAVPEMQTEPDGTVRPKRVNRSEVEAIAAYLKENPMSTDGFCILTPYSRQVSALNTALPELAHRNILTVHRSQGREWDTVILSVQDGKHTKGLPKPLRFTSSRGIGLNLINTAVSRAKKKLVLVCDKEFWLPMKDELIGMLAHAAEPYRGGGTDGGERSHRTQDYILPSRSPVRDADGKQGFFRKGQSRLQRGPLRTCSQSARIG